MFTLIILPERKKLYLDGKKQEIQFLTCYKLLVYETAYSMIFKISID